MRLRSLALAAALAASSIPALAASSNLGVLGPEYDGFGNLFAAPGAPVLSDSFSFTLAGPFTGVEGTTTSSGLSSWGLVLLDGMGDQIRNDPTPASFLFTGLTPGMYTLNFVGIGAPTGAFYAGNVHAVPEPESYALMLAGLGAVGFLVSRRRSRG